MAAAAQRREREPRKPQIPVADIVAELTRDAEGWANELLPGGRRQGREYRADDLHGGAGSALSVTLSGERRGRWHNFRDDSGGDLLDLIAACRFGGNIKDAIAFAKQRLGLDDGVAPAERRPPPPPRVPDPREDEEAARRSAYALRLYLNAQASIGETPVEFYLRGRGIDLRRLGRQPRALRFHPGVRNTDHDAYFPAMAAAFNNGAGEHVMTHITFLQQRDGGWKKVAPPADNPKAGARKMYGATIGAFCPIWRGQSGKPLRSAPEGETVVIAEGIETALSVAIACPELRVLAAGSVAAMGRVGLPEAVRTVILAADNDPDQHAVRWLARVAETGVLDLENDPDLVGPRRGAARSLARAIAVFQAEGREVRVAMPGVAGADWNDILQGVEG